MFTGIVEERGEVVAVDRHAGAATVTVRGPRVTADAGLGDSIAVNGACLTVTATSGPTFTADVMAETLRRTALGALAPGSPVNLERPLRLGGRRSSKTKKGHGGAAGELAARGLGPRRSCHRVTVPRGPTRETLSR